MKKAAVFPASGIGDALLMLIASYNLQEAGYHVTTYQPTLSELEPWLRNKTFTSPPHTYDFKRHFALYDLIILQNDNSEKAKHLIKLRSEGHLPGLVVFYPTYNNKKHSPLFAQDYVFEEGACMVENIARAVSNLLKLAGVSRNNGLSPLPHLQHRKYTQRIVIHPTSSASEKNWPQHKFLKLAEMLHKKDFEVVFAVSEREYPYWSGLIPHIESLPRLRSLSDLAALIYESGYIVGNDSLVGHLASNLQIPSVVIANDEKRMKLWRPGWLKGEVVTPPSYLRKWGLLRSIHWGSFISVRKVYNRLHYIHRVF